LRGDKGPIRGPIKGLIKSQSWGRLEADRGPIKGRLGPIRRTIGCRFGLFQGQFRGLQETIGAAWGVGGSEDFGGRADHNGPPLTVEGHGDFRESRGTSGRVWGQGVVGPLRGPCMASGATRATAHRGPDFYNIPCLHWYRNILHDKARFLNRLEIAKKNEI
jgi:hypothetical protein